MFTLSSYIAWMSVDHIISCFVIVPPSAYTTSKYVIVRRNFSYNMPNSNYNLNKYENLMYLPNTTQYNY